MGQCGEFVVDQRVVTIPFQVVDSKFKGKKGPSTREDAIGEMAAECKRQGGNAIVGMRFDAVSQGDAAYIGWDVCAYGTAVRV